MTHQGTSLWWVMLTHQPYPFWNMQCAWECLAAYSFMIGEGAIESKTSRKLMAHANCFLSLSYIKLLVALHLQAAYCLAKEILRMQYKYSTVLKAKVAVSCCNLDARCSSVSAARRCACVGLRSFSLNPRCCIVSSALRRCFWRWSAAKRTSHCFQGALAMQRLCRSQSLGKWTSICSAVSLGLRFLPVAVVHVRHMSPSSSRMSSAWLALSTTPADTWSALTMKGSGATLNN